MMTVPMENASAPSGRELVQHLYNKNTELEKGLRKSIQSKIPSDPNIWGQMRENYETIILEDHDFSESHEIEHALWHLHYNRIEDFRARIRATSSSSAGSIPSQSGKGIVRREQLTKIRSVFKSFLSEVTGFYHDLILKIRAKYGLPLGYFSDGADNQIILAKDGKRSVDMKKGLLSCHRCLIYLGDLARYKELYGEGDFVSRDFAAASSYYIQAASLWPSSGNPHHQLAILATYLGDDLVAVYRYFRSLAVDSPFSTARDNLIIIFEKNRQSYSQLSTDVKASPAKTMPVRSSGRGRGRGETRLLAKDIKTETAPPKEKAFSILEIYKNFCVRFVRLNGILFTRTSLETFTEIFSALISDLLELLSSGPEEELIFGSDAADNRLVLVRLVSILIFTVHNVNRETEGQSYAEILQRSVLLQNAFTATFEFMGHILKRSLQLQDVSSSSLLPAILVFIEWLACRPDIAAVTDAEEKQATARSFFWIQWVSFMNKLMQCGIVPVDCDGAEAGFLEMIAYDEEESDDRLALWEDIELRGFLPLVPAQLILDFSRKHFHASDGSSSKEKKARVQRILAAGRALMNVVRVDKQGIYFDQKLKGFAIGVEPKRSEDPRTVSSSDLTKANGTKQGNQSEETRHLVVLQSNAGLYTEGEEEDEEVIVFKPTLAEKGANVSAKKIVEVSSKGDWSSFIGAANNPVPQAASLNGNMQPLSTFANSVQQPLEPIIPSTSAWLVEHQAAHLEDGLTNLNISGGGFVAQTSPAFSVPLPLSGDLNAASNGTGNGFVSKTHMCEDLGVLPPRTFSVPFSPSGDLDATNGPSSWKFSEAMIPSKFDLIMPSVANPRPSFLTASLKKNPVSRPVRHFGPPPGFGPVPPKQLEYTMVNSIWKNEQPPADDYSWLDGYEQSSNKVTELNQCLTHTRYQSQQAAGDGYTETGMMSFPFPGKQVPDVRAQAENLQWRQAHQLPEHLKLYQEQQQMLQKGLAPLPDQYQGQSLWSGRFV